MNVKKEGEVRVCVYKIGYYSVIKNEAMPSAATRMDRYIIILSEVKSDRERKYHVISLICGI